jgi:hypothetical protein
VIDHDLKELDECSKKWLMSFSPDKTEIMLFSNTDIPEFNFTHSLVLPWEFDSSFEFVVFVLQV